MEVLSFVLLVIHQWSFGYSDEIKPRPVIVGGSPIAVEEAPFMAIYCKANDRNRVCGAAIITERFALSAAHCYDAFDNLESKSVVIVGTDERAEGGQIYNIKKSIVHPNYNTDSTYNGLEDDVVVLKLRGRLIFSEKVQSIKMADARLSIKPGASLEVFGFGDEYRDAPERSKRLRRVSVPYVSTAKCRSIYRQFDENWKITDNMICAGAKGRDSCQSDSGGPLVYNNVLVGVVSFGKDCAVYPGVYTRVAKMRNFIDTVIKKY